MKKLFLMLALAAFAAAPAFANESSTSTYSKTSPSKSAASSATSTSSPSSAASSTSPSAAASKSTTASASACTDCPAGLTKLTGPKGEYWATASGLTIYTFAKDTSGTSTCTGACAKSFPALAATSTDAPIGEFTIINGNQWAYDGAPLYTSSADKKRGDMNGASTPGWSVAFTSPPSSVPAN